MEVTTVKHAALQFGHGEPVVELLGQGLIHKTYKVSFSGNSRPIVLQSINRSTFKHPENIIHNYQLLYRSVTGKNGLHIPPLVATHEGDWFWIDESRNFWRATEFVQNSYTVSFPRTSEEVYITAKCFGTFTRSLAALDTSQLTVIIPGFHDLTLRYQQFEQAVGQASMERLLKSTHIIAEVRDRKHLVNFYAAIRELPGSYPLRVMHHDCKLSNILLDAFTHQALCPVDLDTVMPGLYFSDIGDMIRSMAGTVDENSVAWEKIGIRKDFYESIIAGYLEGIGDTLTPTEKKNIHQAGLLMLYMQCMRFVTDFLNNDSYYQISYPEQNLNRALNQLIMLERLEEFLQVNRESSMNPIAAHG